MSTILVCTSTLFMRNTVVGQEIKKEEILALADPSDRSGLASILSSFKVNDERFAFLEVVLSNPKTKRNRKLWIKSMKVAAIDTNKIGYLGYSSIKDLQVARLKTLRLALMFDNIEDCLKVVDNIENMSAVIIPDILALILKIPDRAVRLKFTQIVIKERFGKKNNEQLLKNIEKFLSKTKNNQDSFLFKLVLKTQYADWTMEYIEDDDFRKFVHSYFAKLEDIFPNDFLKYIFLNLNETDRIKFANTKRLLKNSEVISRLFNEINYTPKNLTLYNIVKKVIQSMPEKRAAEYIDDFLGSRAYSLADSNFYFDGKHTKSVDWGKKTLHAILDAVIVNPNLRFPGLMSEIMDTVLTASHVVLPVLKYADPADVIELLNIWKNNSVFHKDLGDFLEKMLSLPECRRNLLIHNELQNIISNSQRGRGQNEIISNRFRALAAALPGLNHKEQIQMAKQVAQTTFWQSWKADFFEDIANNVANAQIRIKLMRLVSESNDTYDWGKRAKIIEILRTMGGDDKLIDGDIVKKFAKAMKNPNKVDIEIEVWNAILKKFSKNPTDNKLLNKIIDYGRISPAFRSWLISTEEATNDKNIQKFCNVILDGVYGGIEVNDVADLKYLVNGMTVIEEEIESTYRTRRRRVRFVEATAMEKKRINPDLKAECDVSEIMTLAEEELLKQETNPKRKMFFK